MVGHEAQPSLALELFGRPVLVRATRVNFSLPTNDTLNVTVWEGMKPVFAQTLTSPGDFICKGGVWLSATGVLLPSPQCPDGKASQSP